MNTLSLPHRRRIGIAAALLLAFIPAIRSHADASAPAGIVYDSTAALDASTTPLFDAAKAPAILSWNVTYKGAEGQSVPGIFMTSAKPGPKPAVLLLHGLGGKKEDMKPAAVVLASRGFSVLSIDAAGHGSRPMIDGKPVSQLDIEGMHHLAGETVVDLRRAVDWLQTRPEVDKEKIGYLGVSMGGILGGVFVGEEPRIKAAVLWAAGGNWGTLIATTTHPFAAAFRKNGTVDPAKVEAVMSDVDPLTTIGKFAPRPLLFLNGDHDTVVPSACSEALYAAAANPKERILLPGGHIPDPTTMMLKSMDWLSQKLGLSAATTASVSAAH